MSKKAITVILIVLGLFSVLICACAGVAFVAGGAVIGEGNKIITSNLKPICETHGNMTDSEYEKYFASSFTTSYSLEEANLYISTMFPESLDCDALVVNNIIDLFTKKMSIEIKADSSGSVASISFPGEDKSNYAYYEKEGDNWKITGLEIK